MCNSITPSHLKDYFVKFVPYNVNTLFTLINKKIKFSTAYDFNDFNELRYMATGNHGKNKEYNDRIKDVFKEKFKSVEFKHELLKYSYLSGQYSKQKNKAFEEAINNYTNLDEFFEKHNSLIEEYLVFSNVGIFCLSSLEVFENEAAQLMFAHYGGGLGGLALIYEVSPQVGVEKITYVDCTDVENSISGCVGDIERIFRWIDKKFEKRDLDDFILKSKMWCYEKEYRCFSAPGINKSGNLDIHLKAVLFTPRLDRNAVETLENIIMSYEKKVFLQEIYVSTLFGRPSQFKIEGPERLSVIDWLNKKIGEV